MPLSMEVIMNKKHLFLFIIISLVIGVVSYIVLENIFISIGLFAVYLLVSFLILLPTLKKYDKTIIKYHECYHFENNFIISLSIKKSIPGALETTVNSMPSEFVDQFNSLENMSDNQKLDYLASYFTFYDYQLFLQIINLWQEEGGDIIAMSKYLTAELRNNEEYLSKCETMSRRKYFEVGVLWMLSLAILIFLRFALKDFYMKVKTQLIFIISVVVLNLFILFSIYLLIKKGTKLGIKGYQTDEKNI